MNKPLFIVFEGLDGCGKSLQSQALYQKFTSEGLQATLLHEPGSTPIGDEISQLVKWHDKSELDAVTELFLFSAARNQLIKDVILPSLQQHKHVIVDRFIYSTLAYQGYGKGLDIEMVKQINRIATGGCLPDIIILLDLSFDQAYQRRNDKPDRFESRRTIFHTTVRNAYLKMADEEPQRWFIVDGSLEPNTISHVIWDYVKLKLSRQD
jgi:dTMP kinase